MPKIEIEIKNCKECPFVDIRRHYSEDSFETAYDWFCKKKNLKKIQGYIDWHEQDSVQIPKWCPIKIK